MTTAADLIEVLGLEPHPEGGWHAETFRGPAGPDGRATSTVIYFLLEAGQRSHWHTVDADELWLHHAGAPLELRTADGVTVTHVVLGPDLAAGERPQQVVPAGVWQSATTTGEWTLVSCVVAPGFEFDGFELAPPGWEPHRD
jgi:predicted cupin superfamily sugar epimerase